MGWGGHLPRRPQGIWPVGTWDVTATWLHSWLAPSSAALSWQFEDYRPATSPNVHLLKCLHRASSILSPSSCPCFVGAECIPSPQSPILHPPPPAWPHQRDREAVPRLSRGPPEGQGEPVLVLRWQPARQRPVGGAQLRVPPETGQDRTQPLPAYAGVSFFANPMRIPWGRTRSLCPGTGDAEEAPLQCGDSELPPPPAGAGLPCPGERCCFQWEPVVSLEGGGASGGRVPTGRILVGAKFRRVRQQECCLERSSGKTPGWAVQGRWAG